MRYHASFVLAASCLCAVPAGMAQSTQTPAAAAAPAPTVETPSTPLLPLAGVHYRYWQLQIVQWIGPELPYSMVVLDVDRRASQPVYDCTLIPKDGGKGVRYTNSPLELKIDEAAGFTVYQVPMQLDGPPEPQKGAQYLLRFNTEKNVPVVWQFVQGTDETDRGSGLTPIDAKVPVLLYREQGALAAEGTAIQIGGVTSTADVWQEFAQPPYFVPYHGAISEGIHILTMVPGAATWKKQGDTSVSEEGESLAGNGAMTNSVLGTEAKYTSVNGSIEQVVFGPAGARPDSTITLAFRPGLGAAASSQFTLVAGKKTKLATGTVTYATAPGGATETWAMQTPKTLEGKSAAASITLAP